MTSTSATPSRHGRRHPRRQGAEAGKLNLEKVTPLGLVFTAAIQKYVDFADEVGQRVAREASARINGALAFLVAALAVVAALVVGVYAVFARAVFRPLHEAGRCSTASPVAT